MHTPRKDDNGIINLCMHFTSLNTIICKEAKGVGDKGERVSPVGVISGWG